MLDAQRQETEAKRAAELAAKRSIAQQQVHRQPPQIDRRCPVQTACQQASMACSARQPACHQLPLFCDPLYLMHCCQRPHSAQMSTGCQAALAQELDVQRFQQDEARKKAEKAGAMETLKVCSLAGGSHCSQAASGSSDLHQSYPAAAQLLLSCAAQCTCW